MQQFVQEWFDEQLERFILLRFFICSSLFLGSYTVSVTEKELLLEKLKENHRKVFFNELLVNISLNISQMPENLPEIPSRHLCLYYF